MVEDIAFPLGGAASDGAPALDAPVQCSARRCRAAAAYQLRWNNPRLHPAEVRKTWLACSEHRESLSDFLRARRFLREVEPFPPVGATEPAPSSNAPDAGGRPRDDAQDPALGGSA